MTENESFKEFCQREAFILGLFLWQTVVSMFSGGTGHGDVCSTHGLCTLRDVWGFVTLALKIQTS